MELFQETVVNWPPKSYDLTPVYHFLLGDGRSQVYKNNPQIISELKVGIIDVICYIEPQLY